MTTNLDNYTCSDKGLLLPAINEYTWAIGLRIFLYCLGLVWCFVGIAIVADVFMCGIEKITSKTRVIKISNPKSKDGFDEIEVKVWNDTVANLSLMAFGTSAPEILLNVIDIIGQKFKARELGPGTIVGSASFNLLVITAICIIGIPKGETRRIMNVRVYSVTTIFSMFAYIWLLIVLVGISPEVVDLWEAILTFLMFPALIVTSFLVDKKCFCIRNKTSSELELGIDTEKDDNSRGVDIIHLAKELGRHREIKEEDAAKIAAVKLSEQKSHNRAWYRINATRGLTGGARLVPHVNKAFTDLYKSISTKTSPEEFDSAKTSVSTIDLSEGGSKAVVEFTSKCSSCLENEGKIRLGIKRTGKMDIPVSVWVETIDGSAESGSDYVAKKEKICFETNEMLRETYIEIIDDDVWEPDELFFAKLYVDSSHENAEHTTIGKSSINTITIINDDEPGKFEFSKPSYVIPEGMGKAQLFVNRVNGADGAISVRWTTKDMSAVDGKDYYAAEGTLNFSHGETSKTIDVNIMISDLPERDNSFMVELKDPTQGAELGKITKTIVTIVNDDEFRNIVSRIAEQTQKNLDSLKLESSSWGDQFKAAMNVNGGDVENATRVDYVLHFCSFFWKVLFAFIPPPSVGGGWLTFGLALAVIGLLTALVGDLATIFGCLIGLNDYITAITFVALGTSMPDTFASKQAAVMEKHADSSIGNINGSNAVNVFLGMGLPWLIASIYWLAKGEDFEVPKGSIVFSVILYLSCAVTQFIILLVRRHFRLFGRAELGGPVAFKLASGIILAFLWVFYVLISSLQSVDIIEAGI